VATKPDTIQTESAGVAVLEQLAGLDPRRMSGDTARTILKIEFDESRKQRVTALSQKAQEGTLQTDERAELDEYIRVADLLAVLQSRARQALKRNASSA
jgi:hypothetical protein